MLLLECSKIKKYFEDRLIVHIDDFKIYYGDRIGIVGANGSGKTTLLNLLSHRLEPDEGVIKLYEHPSYISQLEPPKGQNIGSKWAHKFGINPKWDENWSGGEMTRFKVALALEENSKLLFADEPTSNVDMESIALIEEKFKEYKGALVVISHDRSFLDKLCNQILEIEDGRVKIYKGNYSDYYEQKIKERERLEFEYEQYITEKRRLEQIAYKLKQKEQSISRAPKRMGNSEARLHKMGGQKEKARLDSAVKNVRKRIEHLEVKEKPKKQKKIQLDILESDQAYSKIIMQGQDINKVLGNKIIFQNAHFAVENGAKIALIGPNGCGKSTLIKMIMEKDPCIKVSERARIGYFSQDLSILDSNVSILENVMETSIYPESFARLLLARLLFRGESVYKKAGVLSGGELVKVSFAKILLQDINMLLLDEPTNYLDIPSLEVVEETLKEYDRTLLFVSHDRHFINTVARQIMTIEDKQINLFNGSYKEYLAKKYQPKNHNKLVEDQIMILNNRLSEIIGKLSMVSKQDEKKVLETEYEKILRELNELKKNIYIH